MANPPTTTAPDPTKDLQAQLAALTKERDAAKAELAERSKQCEAAVKQADAYKADLDKTGKKLAEVVAELGEAKKLLASKPATKSSNAAAATGDSKAPWVSRPWLNIKVDREDEENQPANATDRNEGLGAPTNQTR